VSAEELKGAVQSYADQHQPGWVCASVTIRVGELTEGLAETLLVTSSDARHPLLRGALPEEREGTPVR
jgi:hypothetical protein